MSSTLHYSSNLSTTIELSGPDLESRRISAAQVNFKLGLDELIAHLADCTRLAPKDPKVIADTVEIIIGKEKRELTQEVLEERQDYFFNQNLIKRPKVHIIMRAHKDLTSEARAASRGRLAGTTGQMPAPKAPTPCRSGNPGKRRATTAVVPPPAPVPAALAAPVVAPVAVPTAAPIAAHVAFPVTVPEVTPVSAPIPAIPTTNSITTETTSTTTSAAPAKKVKTTKQAKELTPEEIAEKKRTERQMRGNRSTFVDVGDTPNATEDASKLSEFNFEVSDASDDDEEEESDEEEAELNATDTAPVVETMAAEPAAAPAVITGAAPCTPPRPAAAAAAVAVEQTPIATPAPAAVVIPLIPATCADNTTAAPATPSAPSVPKTPVRSASRTRTGVRSSIMSATKSSVMRTTDDNTLYGNSRTFSEQKMHIINGLHATTGSMALASATKAAASMRTAVTQNTPGKKTARSNVTAPNDGMDDAFAAQMASASKTKRNPDGRPSLGTIENQWEYMRQNFFNNDDEEITWSMVSRNKGAYKHAHMKYERAEDRYFKSLHEITTVEGHIQSFTSGSAAKVVTVLNSLAALVGRFFEVPESPETNRQIDELLERLSTLVNSGNTTTMSLKESANQNSVLEPFTAITIAAILGFIEPDANAKNDRKTMMRHARQQGMVLAGELPTLKANLAKANRQSDEALEYMEKWSRREKDANDYAETIRQQEVAWLEENYTANYSALIAMRTFIPLNVADLSIADIMQTARDAGGLLSLELATELKQNKLLHWIVTHTDDIAFDSFLSGDRKAIFETFDTLDVTELRAIACVLPMKFENDKDGKKAEWRSRFFAKVRAVVSQQNGELVKGPYNPAEGKRSLVQQAPLKPDQVRRAVYFYRTKEKSQIKVKQYNDRVALLARRETALAHAETAAVKAKAEYDIVLSEMRDPAFIEEYGAETLTMAKEQAKDMLTTANSTLKSARMDLTNLRNTIAAMPVSREQYLEQEAELVAFLQENNRIDWTQRGLAPVAIEGVLTPVLEVPKAEKVLSKALTAEEEAALRKEEMERIFSKKPDFSTANAAAGDDIGEATVDVPSTPARDAPIVDGAVGNAPNTEFRRLSVAATSMFSPARRHDSLRAATPGDNLAQQELATPRKRNSVLANANPEMLNTLNKMMLSSPAATPSGKMGRQSIFMPQSAAKLAMAAGADENGGVKAVEKKPVATRSEILKRLMNPGAVSPKRTPLGALGGMMGPPTGFPGAAAGGPPKLGFLAQLTARVGLKSAATTTSAASEDGPGASASAGAGAAAPALPARSLFADILKFRKPDVEESSTAAASAAAENKENSGAGNTNAVVEPASVSMSKPAAAAARPMMSLFDEIRKRRVVE